MITVPKLFVTLTITGMVTTMFLAAVGSTLYLATMTLMLFGFTGCVLCLHTKEDQK